MVTVVVLTPIPLISERMILKEHRTVMVVLTTVSPTCPQARPHMRLGITEKLVSDFFEDFTIQHPVSIVSV